MTALALQVEVGLAVACIAGQDAERLLFVRWSSLALDGRYHAANIGRDGFRIFDAQIDPRHSHCLARALDNRHDELAVLVA